jgi:hypothetical protein
MSVPTFDTPEPISVTIDAVADTVHITAGVRGDTVVEVRPADASNPADVRVAGEARVEFKRGRLVVRTPTPLRRRRAVRGDGAVDVVIALPEGSHVRGGTVLAALRTEGRLGECRFETVDSDVRLDRTGRLHLDAVGGDISLAQVDGHARITNEAGTVRVDEIAGSAVIRNQRGEISVGEISGPLDMGGVSGTFHVRRAHGDVAISAARGEIRVDEVIRGTVALQTAFGGIEVGIREGTAARLDLRTISGSLRNSLTTVDGPRESDEVVQVRARSVDGDILIRRSDGTH